MRTFAKAALFSFFMLLVRQAIAEPYIPLNSTGSILCDRPHRKVYRVINGHSVAYSSMGAKSYASFLAHTGHATLSASIKKCTGNKLVSACEAVTSATSFSHFKSDYLVHGQVCASTNSNVVLLTIANAGATLAASCTGSIISSSPIVVLTAAHCLNPSELGFTPGSVVADVGTSEISATVFDFSSTDDVGVAVFAESTSLTAVPRYDSSGTKTFSPLRTVLAGYGLTSGSNSSIDGALRAGDTLLLGLSTSGYISKYIKQSSGACFGDSGGPILVLTNAGWQIFGVTSTGTSSKCSVGGLLTSVNVNKSSVLAFIRGYAPDF